ncbi:MAG: acetyl-CoA carboxylase biotin carboxylase subunit [Ignavibacteriaceae bacterium]
MFNKILIANRGEIAVRIIRACKELGIKSAAIYSTADKTSLHTRLADEAYFIGEAIASESYLNKNKIIDLAKKIKADAIHPGYGFFSENADFIKSVEEEGIEFIGPSSNSVKMMGNKTEARKLMKYHGVPIVPGTIQPVISVEEGIKSAEEIGFPVLLKASEGGGGKGMRKISSASEFENAYEATQREALKAFGCGDIYIEKFIEHPKHIEVQIIADRHGNYVHLYERDCSVQRRHQKIIEEAPSSFVDEETRNKITVAAINAAKACKYYNAGTIEMLMDKNKDFYFLEMNTRIQVEHPVTELISGIDLVKEQITIAAGENLSFSQTDIKIHGHAIECRIYAEDPDNNFLPSTGIINEYTQPNGPGVRVDGGSEGGSEISIYYDPLIAKLVCWSDDRISAISRMNRALSEFHISGITTNISFLQSILENKTFKVGTFDINFIESEMDSLLAVENQKENKDLIDAAIIFAAIVKNNQHSNHNGHNGRCSINNKWTELSYE